jgi:hypothetical protein
VDNAAEIQHWVAIAKEVEIHKGGSGNPQALRDWYNDGADGQIDWGSEGDIADCVAIAGKYLDNPEGFCQLRHIDATGEPAGQAAGEITKADEIDYTEVFSSKDGKPSDQDLYEQVKVDAKAKFDVYPSAVANGWVVQEYKRRGGKYRKPVAKGLDESIADVLRHDLAHDNWHRMHGDEPCKSEADCARMRANYSEDKPIEVEKSDITIEKGDLPGHEFRGNQHSHLAREHFRARRSHKVSESQARQVENFKAARLHGQAMAAHKTAEILAEKNSPDYPKARQRAQEATAKANLAQAIGKIRKDAAPLDPYNQQAESLVKEAEAETNKALALQKRGQYESAQYAHANAAELYRQAAEIEDDGNADVLDDLAKEADDAAKYCEFFYSQGENHSPAEIDKATGKVPPFRGRPTSDDTPDGSQDWGWMGEGEEVDDSSTDDTSEAEDD